MFPPSLELIQAFMLVLVRVASLVACFPVFTSDGVPLQVKAALSFVLALCLLPVVAPGLPKGCFPASVAGFALLVMGEIFIGLSLGLMVRMVLSAAELAGEMIGYQMGFGIVAVIDPQSGAQTSVVAEFTYLLALLVFLAADGHHVFFRAMAASFGIVPPGGLTLHAALSKLIVEDAGRMFVLAVRIGAPAIAALLFTTLAFALMSRAMPQLNVLIVGFPVSIAVGLIFFGLSLELSLPLFAQQVSGLSVGLTKLLRAM